MNIFCVPSAVQGNSDTRWSKQKSAYLELAFHGAWAGGRETEKETDKEMGKKIKRVGWGQVWRKINQGRGQKVREQAFMIIES